MARLASAPSAHYTGNEFIGADGTYLGAVAGAAKTYNGHSVVQPGAHQYSATATAIPVYPASRVYVEPQAPEEDPNCAFWSMVFSLICCVGCISFCINCSAAPGSKRLRYARIGCAISCVVGKWLSGS